MDGSLFGPFVQNDLENDGLFHQKKVPLFAHNE